MQPTLKSPSRDCRNTRSHHRMETRVGLSGSMTLGFSVQRSAAFSCQRSSLQPSLTLFWLACTLAYTLHETTAHMNILCKQLGVATRRASGAVRNLSGERIDLHDGHPPLLPLPHAYIHSYIPYRQGRTTRCCAFTSCTAVPCHNR